VRYVQLLVPIDGRLLTLESVSQFTLLASVKKGNKPDFHKSANAEKAKELYEQFFNKVQALYQEDRVKDGVFQAMMDVALVNDGPVGVDYTCEDGAVNISMLVNVLLANVLLITGHHSNRHGSSQDGQSY
jgi:D-tyrosyl-tRNA(Tyr) deacylase